MTEDNATDPTATKPKKKATRAPSAAFKARLEQQAASMAKTTQIAGRVMSASYGTVQDLAEQPPAEQDKAAAPPVTAAVPPAALAATAVETAVREPAAVQPAAVQPTVTELAALEAAPADHDGASEPTTQPQASHVVAPRPASHDLDVHTLQPDGDDASAAKAANAPEVEPQPGPGPVAPTEEHTRATPEPEVEMARAEARATRTARGRLVATPAAADADGGGDDDTATPYFDAVERSFESAKMEPWDWQDRPVRLLPDISVRLADRLRFDKKSRGNRELGITHYIDAALQSLPSSTERQIALGNDLMRRRRARTEAGKGHTPRLSASSRRILDDLIPALEEKGMRGRGVLVVSAALEWLLDRLDEETPILRRR